jgi:polyhydroxyalkanoate synthesis regulator phasin
LKKRILKLNNMLYLIDLIKKWKITQEKAPKIINNIITELKTLNIELKSYIKIKIHENQKKINILKNKYYSKIIILTKKLQNISNILSKKISNNKLYKKNEYIRHINKLNLEIKSLRKVNNKKFNSKKDFWNYLKDKIIKIKLEIFEIKKILKENKSN